MNFKNICFYIRKNIIASFNLKHFFKGRNRHPSFLYKLIFSYFLILVVCVFIMGTLSYKLVTDNIKDRAIKSNNKLLNQFRNTTDSLILGNINELSLKMLQDSQTIPYISNYFSHSLNGNIVDTLNIDRYLSNLKTVNPMLYSIGFYFENNHLLMSTEFIRHTLYQNLSEQEPLKYYYDLVHSTNSLSWFVNNNYKLSKYLNEINPVNNIIHMIRVIKGAGSLSEVNKNNNNNISSNNNNNINNNIDGAIIISIKEDIFYNVIKKSAAEDLDEIIIIDDQGLIISHVNKECLGRNIKEFEYGSMITDSKDPEDDTLKFFITSVNDVPSVISYCVSNYNDWKYVTITPMENYTGAASFFIRVILIIALLTIVIGAILSTISARKLSNPLEKLALFCRGFANSSESKTRNEYSIIHSTINNLSEKIKEQDEQFRENLPILKTNFIHNLISNNINDDDDMRDKMKLLSINLPYPNFCIVVVKIKRLSSSSDLKMYEYEKIGILSYLEKVINTNYICCLYCEKENNLVIVANYGTSEKKLFALINSLQEYKCKFTPLKLYFSIGKPVNSLSFIHDSYQSSITAIKYSYIYPEKFILSYGEIAEREGNSIYTNYLFLRNLEEQLKLQNREKSLLFLEEVIIELEDNKYSFDEVNKAIFKIVSLIEETIASLNMDTEYMKNNFKDTFKKLKNAENILESKNLFISLINKAFDYIESKQCEKNKDIVCTAQEFIQRNIHDCQLSLSAVAEALGVSQSHLSRIFKNEAGLTFVDYVTSLKLEYCRDLLLSTDLKIEDISSTMGYSTSQYFISRFKKKYGFTPNEYRLKSNINRFVGLADNLINS